MRVGSGNFWQFLRRGGNSNTAGAATDVANARTALGLGTLATLSSVATVNIDDDAVTFAKMQNLAASRVLGRGSAGGAGNPEELTMGGGMSISGTALLSKIAQFFAVTSVTYQTCSNPLPVDNSIPLATDGDAVTGLSQAITPLNAASTILVIGFLNIGASTIMNVGVSLTVSGNANAIDATSTRIEGATAMEPTIVIFPVSAASVLARTYGLRTGPNAAGSAFVNGDGAGRQFGGVALSGMLVLEILP